MRIYAKKLDMGSDKIHSLIDSTLSELDRGWQSLRSYV
jgi:hypothetical protein